MTADLSPPEQHRTSPGVPAGPRPAGPSPAGGAPAARDVGRVLSGLLLAMFVSNLASTIVANALPRIVADLGSTQAAYTWVITAELLAMTAAVPLWGKLADLYDKKILIQTALGLFIAGSLIAGLTQNVEFLIFSRVIQGIGAGGVNALAIVVLASMVSPREMGRYAGLFSAVFGAATIVAPLAGGLLVDTSWLGWRWCFFLGVPLSIIAGVMLQRTMHLPVTRRPVRIDWLGAALIVGGVCTLLIWSTLAGDKYAWASWQTAALVSGGVLLLVLAWFVESRAAEPIIPPSIFRNRTVAFATLATAVVGVVMFATGVFLSQYLQISLGKSPTVAGVLSLPLVFGMLAASTVAGGAIAKSGSWKPYLVAGAVLMTAGMLLFSLIDADTSLWVLGAIMVVAGAGVGLLIQNLVMVTQNDVPAQHLGVATATVSFFRSMGGAIGVSALGAVLANRVSDLLQERLGAAAAGGGGSTRVPDLSELPPPVLQAVQEAYGTATADLFLVAAPISLVAVVAVVLIKNKPLQMLNAQQRRAKESAGTPAE
ncbi:MDR family MFS transporter [Actinoplanes oblitus]|uniref:MDR family MFS transporter n=1 Tax=Actinoplanes oblitus TaxID=3040509 RepID=A0ABY8W969_9ACTN|nr:MDR family MFS transporter [Actinoplanes oblitus]WIM94386.1 MDR family MFS transporter [Actinoplanes oblitus]